jgi:undecaprenyl-diphosphatase
VTTARRLWWAAVAATVAFFAVLGAAEWSGRVVDAERSVLRRVRLFDVHHPVVDHVVLWVTKLGDPRVLTGVVVIAAALLLSRHRARAAVFVVLVSLSGGVLNRVAKAAIARERPTPFHRIITVHGSGFPSGHAMGATVVFGAVLFVVWPHLGRTARVLAVAGTAVVVVAVAASRVLLGAHWPLDVVGGVLLGAAWVLAWGAFMASRSQPSGSQ